MSALPTDPQCKIETNDKKIGMHMCNKFPIDLTLYYMGGGGNSCPQV